MPFRISSAAAFGIRGTKPSWIAERIQTRGDYHTDVDIVIQTVIQTRGNYHTDVQTVVLSKGSSLRS